MTRRELIIRFGLPLALPRVSADEEGLTYGPAEIAGSPHEQEEGYFGVGKDLYAMVRDGSMLKDWLLRNRGEKVILNISRFKEPELGRGQNEESRR